MTDQAAPVFLKAWPAQNTDQTSLPFLISRILEQKEGFRNVTEQSLQEEIQTGESKSQLGEDGSALEDEELENKPRKEYIRQARDEIGKLAIQAYTESAHALDFISLLLSKYAPRQAEASISPFLKQAVPIGSLGASLAQPPQLAESKAQDDEQVSAGWKLQSLNNAADSILRSAAKLEKEMKLEAKYWADVLAVKEKGWRVCRYPRERQTLGVRYGFLESPSEFQDRGIAAIRRSDEGEIDLDLGSTTRMPQSLRASILHRGQVIARSQDVTIASTEELSVEVSILRARDSIFDSELYHEIYREARDLTNRGVKCLAHGITLPLEYDKTILIELAGSTESHYGDLDNSISDTRDNLPQVIVTALRILLCFAHRQIYQRRSQLPSPLTDKRPSLPPNSILRPVLSQLQHRAALRDVQTSLQRLKDILAEAGIGLDVEAPVNDLGMDRVMKLLDTTSSTPFVQDLVQTLFSPLQSSIMVRSGLQQSEIKIHVRTHASGTEYRAVTVPGSSPALSLINNIEELNFTILVDLEEHMRHIVTLELVLEIEARSRGKWTATSPHEGELTAGDELHGGDFEMLTVRLEPGFIGAQWNGWVGDQTPEAQITWEEAKGGRPRKDLFGEIRKFGRWV